MNIIRQACRFASVVERRNDADAATCLHLSVHDNFFSAHRNNIVLPLKDVDKTFNEGVDNLCMCELFHIIFLSNIKNYCRCNYIFIKIQTTYLVIVTNDV